MRRLLISVSLGAILVSTACGSSKPTLEENTTTAAAAPSSTPTGPTTFADIRSIVEDGGDLAAVRTSKCSYRFGIKGEKVVPLPGAGFCSIQTRMRTTPAFGSEDEVFPPLFPIFKGLFAVGRDPKNRPVRSVFISVQGPITTVGGKTKWDVVFNAECSRAANSQIDWDNVDVDGFKQLCTVRKFVKF